MTTDKQDRQELDNSRDVADEARPLIVSYAEQDAELRKLAQAATPGPWYVDNVSNEGSFGSGPDTHTGFRSQAICDEAKGLTLFDTLNSDACMVDVDDAGAWDSVGEANAAFVARANPAAILSLLDRLAQQGTDLDAYEQLCQLKSAKIAKLEAALAEHQQHEHTLGVIIADKTRKIAELEENAEGWRIAAIGAAKDAQAHVIPPAAEPASQHDASASVLREAWEYRFTHSSAIGNGDTTVGPCLTYSREQAYGVGCFGQRQVFVTAEQPRTAGAAKGGNDAPIQTGEMVYQYRTRPVGGEWCPTWHQCSEAHYERITKDAGWNSNQLCDYEARALCVVDPDAPAVAASSSGVSEWLRSIDEDGYRTDQERMAARILLKIAPAESETDPAELMNRWPTAQAFIDAHDEEYFESNEPVPRLHLAYAVDLLTDALGNAAHPHQAWSGELPVPDVNFLDIEAHSDEQMRRAIGEALAGVRDSTLEEAARCVETYATISGSKNYAAAIRALKTQPVQASKPASHKVPEGYKFVPVEPTPGMVEAANECEASWKSIWPAMLAAAPSPVPASSPSGEQEGGQE